MNAPLLVPSGPPVHLFLDFDGVLHAFFPVEGASDEDNARFRYVPEFEQAVRSLPMPVRIVISSSWRKNRSLDELRQLFSPDIAALVVGVTPVLESSNEPGGRFDEAQAWLAQHAPGAPWVALDDMDMLFRPGAAVVVCPDQFGPVQAAALREAAADPVAYAKAHPVRPLASRA